MPSVEQLERIDVLTYQLGRYPYVCMRNSMPKTKLNVWAPGESDKPSGGASKTHDLAQEEHAYLAAAAFPSPHRRPLKGLGRMGDSIALSQNPKARMLEALQLPQRRFVASEAPTPTPAREAITVSSSLQQPGVPLSTTTSSPILPTRLVRFRVNPEPMEDVNCIHPFTPIERVRVIHKTWRRRRKRELQLDEELEATASIEVSSDLNRLLKSPFWDEEAVLFRFGMGGHAAPDGIPGFDGLFRQHWKDFYVTEIVVDITCPCGGRPLSRDYSFAIPPLPSFLLHGEDSIKGDAVLQEAPKSDVASDITTEGECTASKNMAREYDKSSFRIASVSSNVSAAVLNGGDARLDQDEASFFDVDVSASIEEQRCDALGYLKRNPPQRCPGSGVQGEEERSWLLREGTFDRVSAIPGDAIKQSVPDDKTFEGYKKELERLEEIETVLHQRERRHSVGHEKLPLTIAADALQSHTSTTGSSTPYYLECTLHKQHVAHGTALAAIAQVLRVHPRTISVAGIKDYIGDTVQRVRVEGVSPSSALQANRILHQKGVHITLSDFSYKTTPLRSGELFGNHFRIVLRDVEAPRGAIQDAVNAFVTHGFPNYYGCQRFSWFAGKEDAAFALLRHNWLGFAFRFLNYTTTSRTLRQLLQREKKYPNPVMDEYRRNVVRRLRQIAVEPKDLDHEPFLSMPCLSEPQTMNTAADLLNQKQQLIIWQLREAYFDLHLQSRRLTAQRLSSYLWNQVLTLRLQRFPSDAVLDGDFVVPAMYRNVSSNGWDRAECVYLHRDVVNATNRHQYSIKDVVHPGFSFDGISLPDNEIGSYYAHVCDRYRLDWNAKHSKSGLWDFREPPRPIIRHPIELSFTHNVEARTLTLEFALERGCYANVAITELMKQARCVGAEDLTLLPVPEDLWDRLGDPDPGYVTALQDVYPDYDDGHGTVHDTETIPVDAETETKVWDLPGPLFLPKEEDPYRKAHRWGSRHLLRNMRRRLLEAEGMKRRLFEKPLARKLEEGEIAQYAGHTVPMSPNAPSKRLFFKVLRRNRRYAGAPKMTPRFARMTQTPGRRKALPAFTTLNKDSWNVTW